MRMQDLFHAISKGFRWAFFKPNIAIGRIVARMTAGTFRDRRPVAPGDGFSQERRHAERRRRVLRIPIFVKLVALSLLPVLVIIVAVSLTILDRQTKQFTRQLVSLGESMARVMASNAGDKLLGDEDLALYQLVDHIADNDRFLFALVVDNRQIVRAHTLINEVNKPFKPPSTTDVIKREKGIAVSRIGQGDKAALFFETPIIYQKLVVGKVCLAISQADISRNIGRAKQFLWMLAGFMTVLGILLSLVLSFYFSGPIRKLGEGTRALGLGHFDHRVDLVRNDELGDLALAFNRMAEDLRTKEVIQNTLRALCGP